MAAAPNRAPPAFTSSLRLVRGARRRRSRAAARPECPRGGAERRIARRVRCWYDPAPARFSVIGGSTMKRTQTFVAALAAYFLSAAALAQAPQAAAPRPAP